MVQSVPCIEFRNVSKSLHGHNLLDSISFSIGSGEVVALFSSPTTSASELMSIASGFSAPDAGTVDVPRAPPGTRKRRDSMYTIFSSDVFPPYMTPMNFMALCSKHYDFDMAAGKQAIHDAGLWEFRSRKYKGLSDSKKQLMCMAPLLCASPRAVLINSFFPLSGKESMELFGRVFGRLSSTGTAFIVATDSFAHIRNMATRIILLRDSKILLDVQVRDIGSMSGRIATRIRVSDIAAASRTVPEAKVDRDCLVLSRAVVRLSEVITKLEDGGITILSVERGDSLLGFVPGVFER